MVKSRPQAYVCRGGFADTDLPRSGDAGLPRWPEMMRAWHPNIEVHLRRKPDMTTTDTTPSARRPERFWRSPSKISSTLSNSTSARRSSWLTRPVDNS